jgi:3-isopropylmalate/(R)-2-methylmalate dehydratase small subunit
MEIIEGRVWTFGNNIDTDVIVPGQYLDAPMDVVVKHVLESVNPDFVKEVREGDIIVAGKNFGCGSSRENAPAAIKELGIGCIVTESFGRIFFRNAIAIGLPLLNCSGISEKFKEGDQALVRLSEAKVENKTRDLIIDAVPLSEEMLNILNGGGLLALLKEIHQGKD